MKKILILEDNKVYQQRLEHIISKLPEKVILYIADSTAYAYEIIMENHINLFLIDIILDSSNCNDISGLKFMQAVREIPRYFFTPLIFLTALEDPMLFAYKHLHCYYFVEKPYNQTQVAKLIRQALTFPETNFERENLFFRIDGVIYSIFKKNILYIEGANRKIRIITNDNVYTIPYITLSKIENDLASPNFIRCSRYHIINKLHIEYADFPNRFIKLKGVPHLIEIGEIMKKRVRESLLN